MLKLNVKTIRPLTVKSRTLTTGRSERRERPLRSCGERTLAGSSCMLPTSFVRMRRGSHVRHVNSSAPLSQAFSLALAITFMTWCMLTARAMHEPARARDRAEVWYKGRVDPKPTHSGGVPSRLRMQAHTRATRARMHAATREHTWEQSPSFASQAERLPSAHLANASNHGRSIHTDPRALPRRS